MISFIFSESLLRFGLVPKQCDLELGFDLNQYYNKDDMLNHLERKKSRLSAADHLNYMTKHSFAPAQGDRVNVSVTLQISLRLESF
mgnify:CR=1 FL=1